VSWSVESDFRRIGGRAQVVMAPEAHAVESNGNRHPPVRVEVLCGKRGPYFRIERRWGVTINVAQVDVASKCLLLIVDHFQYGPRRYSRFLCGHEPGNGRAWFATAIPAAAQPRSVDEAKGLLDAMARASAANATVTAAMQ
jgi:hypothetical protein